MEKVLKVTGVCAVLYTIVIIVALVLGGITGLLEDLDAAEALPIMDENRAVAATTAWIFVFAPILVVYSGFRVLPCPSPSRVTDVGGLAGLQRRWPPYRLPWRNLRGDGL